MAPTTSSKNTFFALNFNGTKGLWHLLGAFSFASINSECDDVLCV